MVAEEVEQRNQRVFLSKAGCEIVQRAHLVEPMAGDQLVQWLSGEHALANMDPGST